MRLGALKELKEMVFRRGDHRRRRPALVHAGGQKNVADWALPSRENKLCRNEIQKKKPALVMGGVRETGRAYPFVTIDHPARRKAD